MNNITLGCQLGDDTREGVGDNGAKGKIRGGELDNETEFARVAYRHPSWQRTAAKCFALGLVLSLQGCGLGPTAIPEQPPTDDGSNDAPAAAPDPEKANVYSAQLVANVTPLDSVNQYLVGLNWSAPVDVEAITVRREDESGQIEQLDLLPPAATSYNDQTAAAGKHYVYHIHALANKTLTELSYVNVTIPLDFDVVGRTVLSSVGPQFNRLFIESGATILTNGQDLSIEVGEVVARDGATIDSTPIVPTAPSNTAGSDGGFIHLKALQARGSLSIVAVGQNGGAGQKGVTGATGAKGDKGHDGGAGVTCNSSADHGWCIHWICLAQPDNGGTGYPGQPGGQGTTGAPGGNSSRVLVEIEQPNDFKVTPTIRPGNGGSGGPGGDGGVGGPGGDPGSIGPGVPINPCRATSSGPQGPNGAPGTPGTSGPNGLAGPVCLRLGASSFGDCQAFQ